MAKKHGKMMILSAIVGAAAGGAYYFLKKKNTPVETASDDAEDFDDFDQDLEDEDFSTEPTDSATTANTGSNKNHVHMPTIDIDIDNAKEKIGEKVIETLDKTKEKIEQFNVSEKIDKAKEIVSEMTAPSSEPAYTQMDMSSASADGNTQTESEPADNPAASTSSTYTDSSLSEGTTEKFFDDSQNL